MSANETGTIKIEEIEFVLRNHPAVDEVAVTHDRGKYAERLVAWVVCKPRMDADVSELRRNIEKCLPAHMIPSVFIFTKQLPADANGKPDRTALSFDVAEHGSNGNSPRNLLENGNTK